jgi:hypothetical protein
LIEYVQVVSVVDNRERWYCLVIKS